MNSRVKDTVRIGRDALEHPTPGELGRACALEAFCREYAAFNEAAFAATFPHPFLVQSSKILDPGRSAQIRTRPDSSSEALAASGADLGASPVYLVRKNLSVNVFAGMITVGRAENNDIFLATKRVSKFHAYFNETAVGWQITDAGSTNGTIMDDEPLKSQSPRALRSFAELSFGQGSSFRFLSSEAMFDYIRALLRFGQIGV